jgi:hypothetical protein
MTDRTQAMTETLIDRLRNPMWAHSNIPFDGPQLEQKENLAAMAEAADRIQELEAEVASCRACREKIDCISRDWNYTGPGLLGPSCKD